MVDSGGDGGGTGAGGLEGERLERQGPETVLEAIRRGLTLRCPMCAGEGMFEGLLWMRRGCGRCGFRYERGPGYFLGSTYINYGLTVLLTTWTYILCRFVWGLGRWTLIPGLATFSVIFPVVFFRYARSLWLSIDCCLDRQGSMEERGV
jgi:uncharacterized protein (DUF983 family)